MDDDNTNPNMNGNTIQNLMSEHVSRAWIEDVYSFSSCYGLWSDVDT